MDAGLNNPVKVDVVLQTISSSLFKILIDGSEYL
jgi:hypothetical protein